MEIGAEKLGHKVTALVNMGNPAASSCGPYMSSRGDMKMSLRLIILDTISPGNPSVAGLVPYILVAKMFQEFELAVGSLCQDGGTEWFHDLLDGNSLSSKLIFCRARCSVSTWRRSHMGQRSVVVPY